MGFLFDLVSSTTACDLKEKAPMVFTVNRPKFVFKPKVVLGRHLKEASLGFNGPRPNPKEFQVNFFKSLQSRNLEFFSRGDSPRLRRGSGRRPKRLVFFRWCTDQASTAGDCREPLGGYSSSFLLLRTQNSTPDGLFGEPVEL